MRRTEVGCDNSLLRLCVQPIEAELYSRLSGSLTHSILDKRTARSYCQPTTGPKVSISRMVTFEYSGALEGVTRVNQPPRYGELKTWPAEYLKAIFGEGKRSCYLTTLVAAVMAAVITS